MAKAKIEIRVVCQQHGKAAGHAQHTWQKRDMKKARQAVIDSEHHREMHPTNFYKAELPYRIETREVGPWVEYVEEDSDES